MANETHSVIFLFKILHLLFQNKVGKSLFSGIMKDESYLNNTEVPALL